MSVNREDAEGTLWANWKWQMAKEKSWLIHPLFLISAKTDMGIFHPMWPKETVHFPQSSELPQTIHDFAQIILCWETKILHWRMFRLKQNCFLFLNQITTSLMSSNSWTAGHLRFGWLIFPLQVWPLPLPGGSLFLCARLMWCVTGDEFGWEAWPRGSITCCRIRERTNVWKTTIYWRRRV